MDFRRALGNEGESIAADFLSQKGYRIQQRQYRTPYGEIDLVCEYAGELVFVEVKVKTNEQYGYPEEMVTSGKLRKLAQAIEVYLQQEHIDDRPYRVDVVTIERKDGRPVLHHLEAVDGFPDSW